MAGMESPSGTTIVQDMMPSLVLNSSLLRTSCYLEVKECLSPMLPDLVPVRPLSPTFISTITALA